MLNRHESSYKPHIIEKAKVTGEPTPKPYSKLANQLVNDVFQVNPLTKKPITIETGLREIEPQTIRQQLESEIGELVGLKTYGVDPESAEGKRIKTLTRPLLSAFTKNTYIKSLQVDSYLGFVALSLDFAKDPQLLEHLSIQTGFGGSVNPNINLRIPAYAIPAIYMVENIQKVLD